MRKTLVLLILTFILSGCATYKFQKPDATGAQGYLAYYDDEPILEYTVGKEKSLPDLALAKERFKRRKSRVEYYYKEMDQMESRLKECFWDPPAMILDFFGGVLRWPFVAVADYKYNRNPEYKARVDRLDEEKETLETARLDSLRKELNAYIDEDLAKESLLPTVAEAVVAAPKSQPEVLAAAPEPLPVLPVIPVIPKAIPEVETALVNLEIASVSLAAPVAIKEEPVSLVDPVIVQPLTETKPIVAEEV
ncbi:MAG: hypothetical protein ABIH91_04885, partial [Candidatus Omnitrophota bacterium]